MKFNILDAKVRLYNGFRKETYFFYAIFLLNIEFLCIFAAPIIEITCYSIR